MTPPQTHPHAPDTDAVPPAPPPRPADAVRPDPALHEQPAPPPPPHIGSAPRDPLPHGAAVLPDAGSAGPSKALVGGLVVSGFAAGVAVGATVVGIIAAKRATSRVRNRLLWGAAKRAPKAAIGTGRTAFTAGHLAGRTFSTARHAVKR